MEQYLDDQERQDRDGFKVEVKKPGLGGKMKNMPNDSDFQLLRNRLDDAEKADNRMGKNITDL